ncbi:MAG: PepSY domain-containing protein [Verrucomicrobiae bacterium]|nr:PepSY domain-containing protein [Verrucomicrobiae bacterium]NNJ87167.1 hypothetical protein [Akkermansiaceae bacterium]
MRNWRKVHMYCLGYFKILSLISSCLLLIIGVTGILYNHHHDFDFLKESRVPTAILPGKYQERLDQTRDAQGLGDIFPEEDSSVPIMWVIIDLHNGSFFGGLWGRILYDILGGMLMVLSVTGIYMYFQIRKRARF